MSRLLLFGFTALLMVSASGCTRAAAHRSQRVSASFTDVSAQAGVRFVHTSGAKGQKYMPETVGSGCAFLDFDGDGWLDLLFVNSTDWPGPRAKPHFPALYRNNRDGSFRDVTKEAGLAIDVYGMGACSGDYDNDGDVDIYLTCIGPNHLLRNNGDGTFSDVTRAAGVEGVSVEPGGLRWKWSATAVWLDYDRDGLLDLFVANYVKWTPETDPFCGQNGVKAYCAPSNFEGVPNVLYRNRGGGRFEDVSTSTRISQHIGKSFGVAVADYNNDDWPDIAVSNDTKENFLFVNRDGRYFEEQALEAGLALSAAGVARAGMGIDAADWQNNGEFGLIVGNFSREGLALYRNSGGNFEEVTYPSGVGEPSLLSLTFGLFFFDYDLDGRQDLFAANGHIDDFIQTRDAMVTYEQLPLLYHGEKNGTFTSSGPASGPALATRRVLRGCARGDLDNDGDPDIAVVWNNRKGELWRNDLTGDAGWIGLCLRGHRSNRDGIGALVRVRSDKQTQSAFRKSGGSFLSEGDGRLVFGLGKAEKADEVEIRWPSGAISHYRNVATGSYYLADERSDSLERAASQAEPSRSGR